jgi:hypothetical protein
MNGVNFVFDESNSVKIGRDPTSGRSGGEHDVGSKKLAS